MMLLCEVFSWWIFVFQVFFLCNLANSYLPGSLKSPINTFLNILTRNLYFHFNELFMNIHYFYCHFHLHICMSQICIQWFHFWIRILFGQIIHWIQVIMVAIHVGVRWCRGFGGRVVAIIVLMSVILVRTTHQVVDFLQWRM